MQETAIRLVRSWRTRTESGSSCLVSEVGATAAGKCRLRWPPPAAAHPTKLVVSCGNSPSRSFDEDLESPAWWDPRFERNRASVPGTNFKEEAVRKSRRARVVTKGIVQAGRQGRAPNSVYVPTICLSEVPPGQSRPIAISSMSCDNRSV
jgi:hypothetical protein